VIALARRAPVRTHRGGRLLVLALAALAALAAMPASAHAQLALRAQHGGLRHELFVAGGVGLYFASPDGTGAPPAGHACVVRVRGADPQALEVEADLALGTRPLAPCEVARLPRVAAAGRQPAALLFPRGRGHARAPTETASHLEVSFPDAATAWRVAAAAATAVRDCGHTERGGPDWTELQCECGLRIVAGRVRTVISLQFVQGGERPALCDVFVDATGFDGATLDDTTTACSREGWLNAWSSREDLARVLGPCAAVSGSEHTLRCGPYLVELSTEGRPSGIRIAR
jgi:hypothetical protein